VKLLPDAIVDGLALNDGAEGGVQLTCSKKIAPSCVVSRIYPAGILIFPGILNPPQDISLPRHDLEGVLLFQLRSPRSIISTSWKMFIRSSAGFYCSDQSVFFMQEEFGR